MAADSEPTRYPERWEADVVLRDGSSCHIRPVLPSDADRVRRFHASLSEETIYFRFFAPYPVLSDKDVENFTNVDHVRRVALVALVADEIVGIGRYDQVGDLDAEVAFTVRDDYQGNGLGSILLEHVAVAARERGLRRFIADVLPSNRKMAATFSHAGYHVAEELKDGVLRVTFEIDPTDDLRSVAQAREQRAESRSVERLLRPSSIAVVGASAHSQNLGSLVLHHLIAGKYKGQIYPVHPRVATLRGHKAYASVADIENKVDLVIVAVPNDQVVNVVRDSGAVGAHGVVVMTAGYAELGLAGIEDELQLVSLVRATGMRLVGPRSMGLLNTDPHVSLHAAAAPEPIRRGKVALYCQSAAIATAVLNRISRRKLGISTMAATGNRADVAGHDLMQYWLSDTATDVALMYTETLSEPRKFLRVARDLSEQKPVVVVRAGRTSQSFPTGPRYRRTTLSAAATSELLRTAGVIEADSVGQMVDIGGLLACQPLPPGNRVAVVGDAPELVVLANDTCVSAGLRVSEQASLEAGASQAAWRKALTPDPDTADAVLVVHDPNPDNSAAIVERALLAASGQSSIPILSVLSSPDGLNTILRKNAEPESDRGDVPTFTTIEEAVTALKAVCGYSDWRREDRGVVPDLTDIDQESAIALVESVQARHVGPGETTPLSRTELGELLGYYGIHLAPQLPITNEDEAVAQADEVGWPVILRSTHPTLANRGGGIGVRANLENEASLRAAYLSLQAELSPDARSQLVVQRMVPPGPHCVLSSVEDPIFGPVVSFGLGGTVAELLEDRAYTVPPITAHDAERLLRKPAASPLLFGVGGNAQADTAALAGLIVRVGMLAHDIPQLGRLDLNPVIASPRGPYVVGGAAWLRPSQVRENILVRSKSSW